MLDSGDCNRSTVIGTMGRFLVTMAQKHFAADDTSCRKVFVFLLSKFSSARNGAITTLVLEKCAKLLSANTAFCRMRFSGFPVFDGVLAMPQAANIGLVPLGSLDDSQLLKFVSESLKKFSSLYRVAACVIGDFHQFQIFDLVIRPIAVFVMHAMALRNSPVILLPNDSM